MLFIDNDNDRKMITIVNFFLLNENDNDNDWFLKLHNENDNGNEIF